jgi:decaprenyl-phosphate phosphoribosyltransferase
MVAPRATVAGTQGSGGHRLPAWVRGLRPRHWVKNVLVAAAPLAAGELGDPEVAFATLLALVSFCAASSAVYLVNDVVDRESDRLHPLKRHRPIAAGELSERRALLLAAALAAAALLVALTASWALAVLELAYLVLQAGYALRFKHEPVLDISIVTGGFLMRAVAGGLAAALPLSQWFLLVAGFGSLFIVAGKRYSELHTLGSDAGTRRALVGYTDTYLRFVWSMAAGATVMAYSLWAFEQAVGEPVAWHTVSIAPFVMAMLRYAVDVDAGTAAEPEDIVFQDRVLQVLGIVWLASLSLGMLSA